MIETILLGAGTAIARNFGGWLKNSVADGEIQAIEWKLLAVSTVSTVLVFGLSFLGFSQVAGLNEEVLSVVATMALGPVVDKLINKFWK